DNDPQSSTYGLALTTKALNASANVIQQSDYTYSQLTAGTQVTSLYSTDNGGNISRVDFDFDSFGNLTTRTDYGFKTGGVFTAKRKTIFAFNNNDSNYVGAGLLSLVTDIKVRDAASNALLAHKAFVYDCSDCPNPNPDWAILTYQITHNCDPTVCPQAPPGYQTKFVDRTYKGNVTKVQLWTDPSVTTAQISFRSQQDAFGNLVKQEV